MHLRHKEPSTVGVLEQGKQTSNKRQVCVRVLKPIQEVTVASDIAYMIHVKIAHVHSIPSQASMILLQ